MLAILACSKGLLCLPDIENITSSNIRKPLFIMFWHGLFAGGNTEDSMAVLARHSARFDVLQVQFDPISGKHLAVAGLRTLQVRTQPTDHTQHAAQHSPRCALRTRLAEYAQARPFGTV